jgi:TolA-binding protein
MRQLIEQYPSIPQKTAAEFWIAESLYHSGKTPEASEAFEALAQRTQTETGAWLAIVPLRRAQLLAIEKKWAAALAMAQEIAGKYPNFDKQYEADYVIGRCLFMQAKISDAREAFQRVVDSPTGGRTETAAKADWYIGETYLHQKDYEHAIRAYSRVELLYDLPVWQAAAVLQIGKCYEIQGNVSEAIARYEQVLNQFAQTPFKDEASRRLQVARERVGNRPPSTGSAAPPAEARGASASTPR